MKYLCIFLFSLMFFSCLNDANSVLIDSNKIISTTDTYSTKYTERDIGKIIVIKNILYHEYTVEIVKIFKGYDKQIKDEWDWDYPILEYHLLLRDRFGDIIQNIQTIEKNEDYFDIAINNEFGIPLIKLDFQWRGFHTGPIHYKGCRFYRINQNRQLVESFQYFYDAGIQDRPWANLEEIKIDVNKVFFKYKYYLSIGTAELGQGFITIAYKIENDTFIFDQIFSEVFQTGQFVDGVFISDDPRYFVEPPKKLEFTADDLNVQFQDVLRGGKFIYN